MRNMSFIMTTEQVRRREKTVTRRQGWQQLRPGDTLMAIERGQGLKKGEKVVKLSPIRVVSVTREPVGQIDQADLAREGFPDLTRDEFIALYCKANHCSPHTLCTRIAFEYVEEPAQQPAKLTEGWTWLYNATKWHYFTEDCRSLCRRWAVMALGDLQQGNDDSASNCAGCKQALKRRQQKSAS